ncbi:hypothetical protein JW933_09980, partial [candidate division FCPU426 bacterium]|nr:hypothetical protein [candidate division FCPU426 bacterium]
NPSGQGCRRYLFAKVAAEKKSPRLQPFWRACSISAVRARVPAPSWQKDISGSPGAYWRQFFNSYHVFLNPNLDTCDVFHKLEKQRLYPQMTPIAQRIFNLNNVRIGFYFKLKTCERKRIQTGSVNQILRYLRELPLRGQMVYSLCAVMTMPPLL